MKRALFLDRDGVLNLDSGYIGDPARLVLVPGVVPVLQQAQALGYLLVIITNQSGIARGYFSEDDYAAVTERLRDMCRAHGIEFDGIYHCPHHPEASGPLGVECDCRKPAPGLILKAAWDLDIDVQHSVMVGDKQSDIDAAEAAGVGRRILLPSWTGGSGAATPGDPFAELAFHLGSNDRHCSGNP